MNQPIVSRDVVARQLAISPNVLIRYERMGLVQCVGEGETQGYEPSQVRRIWSITSYQRDLGINLAGVEVILQLRDRMSHLHHHLKDLAEQLEDLVEPPQPPDTDPDQPR
ncbi:MAG: chaperone modulator CbpM [Paludisphaera borealis]|uniref:chaperone modulator CbpM n=1 Tax=Paludisphaera borealis TaxID=1387353 RepID=UPI00283B2070|nr:chaperone modulator CbpM [Paludisphaera borealis]MDR3620693.1 chaperone modulator CbpM [Paludisphaera borealis]